MTRQFGMMQIYSMGNSFVRKLVLIRVLEYRESLTVTNKSHPQGQQAIMVA